MPAFFLALIILCASAVAHSADALTDKVTQLRDYQGLADREVLVLGTHHFNDSVLKDEAQQSIEQLVAMLTRYKPTKVVLEWEPAQSSETNHDYQKFIAGELSIDDKANEVYQLGFRLAAALKHPELYLFDDQTEFIGSLTEFSFAKLTDYAKQHNAGFYDRHEQTLIETFQHNESILQSGSLFEQVALRNSPQIQRSYAQRMHLYENRIGVQENWMGPDWLGRWYQRNVRMTSNVLSFSEPGDRIVIIVGDNHKWVLDYLFTQIPEFTVASSWALLSSQD